METVNAYLGRQTGLRRCGLPRKTFPRVISVGPTSHHKRASEREAERTHTGERKEVRRRYTEQSDGAASKGVLAASRSGKLQAPTLPFGFQGEGGRATPEFQPRETAVGLLGSRRTWNSFLLFLVPVFAVCGRSCRKRKHCPLCPRPLVRPVLAAHLPMEPCCLTWCLFKRRTRRLSFFKPAGRQSTHLASSSLFLSTWHLRSSPTQYGPRPRLFSVSPHPGSRFPAKSLTSGRIVS